MIQGGPGGLVTENVDGGGEKKLEKEFTETRGSASTWMGRLERERGGRKEVAREKKVTV